VLIWKRQIVGVAGKEGEGLGLLGSILAMSLHRGVVPRVSRHPLLLSLCLARTRHLFPLPIVEMPA
jgi:hypothetical protein